MNSKRKIVNWQTPVFITLVCAAALFFLIQMTNNKTSQLGANLLGSLCLAAIIPGLLLCLIAFIFYIRQLPPGAGWQPRSWKAWAIIPVLVVMPIVRTIMTPPGSDLYDHGRSALEARNYRLAAADFQEVISQYPDSPLTRDALALLPDVYTNWINQLTQEHQYLWALTESRELRTVDPGSAELADQLYHAAEQGLSQDDGQDGQTYLKALSSSVCQEADGLWIQDSDLRLYTISTTLAPDELGLSDITLPLSDEPARALACHDVILSFDLSPELTAATPAQLKYVVVLTDQEVALESCTYYQTGPFGDTPIGVLTPRQINWFVQVIQVEDGQRSATQSFKGPEPSCPDNYSFTYVGNQLAEAVLYGQPPTADDVNTWLASVMP